MRQKLFSILRHSFHVYSLLNFRHYEQDYVHKHAEKERKQMGGIPYTPYGAQIPPSLFLFLAYFRLGKG